MSRKLFVGMWAAHNLWLYVFIVLERKDNNKRNALLKEFLLFWKEKLFYAKIFVKWFWLIFDLWAVAHNLSDGLSSKLLFIFGDGEEEIFDSFINHLGDFFFDLGVVEGDYYVVCECVFVFLAGV